MPECFINLCHRSVRTEAYRKLYAEILGRPVDLEARPAVAQTPNDR